MGSPLAMALKPLLNRWLGKMDADGALRQNLAAEGVTGRRGGAFSVRNEHGERVRLRSLEEVAVEVLKEENDEGTATTTRNLWSYTFPADWKTVESDEPGDNWAGQTVLGRVVGGATRKGARFVRFGWFALCGPGLGQGERGQQPRVLSTTKSTLRKIGSLLFWESVIVEEPLALARILVVHDWSGGQLMLVFD